MDVPPNKRFCGAVGDVMRVPTLHLLSALAAYGQLYSAIGFGIGAWNACAMSAATHACYASFVTHRPMSIGGVRFRVGSVTAGDVIRVSLQTVSEHYPTGTVLASGTISIVSGNANSFVQVNFGNVASVGLGQRLAVVADYPSYNSGNIQITLGQSGGYVGLINNGSGLIASGRYDGSAWSQYGSTTALGLVLLNESGVPIQMYWTPDNPIWHGVNSSNTTISAACVSRVPIRIEGLYLSRSSSGNYSPYVNLSIEKGGSTVWQTQWTEGRQLNSTFTTVRVSPPVVVGAGETFIIRNQGSGFVNAYRISNSQPFGTSLMDNAASLVACRPVSGTEMLAVWPLVTPLPMRQSMEVQW